MVKLNKAQYNTFGATLYLIHVNLDVDLPFSKWYADVFVWHDMAMFFASTDGNYSMVDTEEKRRNLVKLRDYILSPEMDIDEAIKMAIGDFEIVETKIKVDDPKVRKLNKAQYRIFRNTFETIRDTCIDDVMTDAEEELLTHDLPMFFATIKGDGLIYGTKEKDERINKLSNYISREMDIDEAIRIAIGEFEVI